MYGGSLSTLDTMRMAAPLFHVLKLRTRINRRLRGLWFRLRLSAVGAHVGRRLSVDRGAQIITSRGARWCVGDRVSLGAGVILSVGDRASLTIGSDVRITHYTIIGAEDSISIADRAQIGEHCSIRDHDHDASAQSMHRAALVSSPVRIGEDSWIGRGVAVLRGSHIGAGAVIGANAVVRSDIPQNAIAAGVPARVIRIRSNHSSDAL
jgi:acetyltransferase-like isoleucine patch superfamily enzyme